MNKPRSDAEPRSLLLVDDDRLILATLSSGLMAAGYVVAEAESVDEAEELLAGACVPIWSCSMCACPGATASSLRAGSPNSTASPSCC